MDTFLDYHSKYLKYKKKYMLLKNTSVDASVDTIGSSTKSRTYLISDNQGLYHDRLREILNGNGFKEVSKQQVLAIPSKHVDFFWMGQSNEEGNRFDKDLYQIKSTLKTLLWRDNSHTQGKDVITNKQQLYLNMNKYFPDICSKHMAKTFLLKNVKSIMPSTTPITSTTEETISSSQSSNGTEENQVVYIVKPAGHGACAGVGVTVVTNDKELEEARVILSRRFKNIIISEYIQNPLLYNGRKFHLRMFILINSEPFSWSFWNRGKAMTAKLSYKKGDWTNKLIHDSHGETTPKDIYFPEDILPKDKYEYIYKQMKTILGAVVEIIKPNTRCYEESKYCCEIFGIDFMITDDYIVKLIEINAEAGYGSKNKDKTKYMAYCSEYFDWFYKESLLPKLFPTNPSYSISNVHNTSLSRTITQKTYIVADKEKEIEKEFVELLGSKGWLRKDINEFPEYVDLFYSRNYSFFYNQLKDKRDYRKIYDIKSNIKSFFWRDDTYKKGKDVVVNKYQLYKNMQKHFPEIADVHMAKTFNILGKDKNMYKEGVYIIRPVGKEVGEGKDIEYVINKKEFEAVVNKYKLLNKYKKIIASEYIKPLLLFEKKKFHIRVHMLFLNNKGKITWSTNLHGTTRHAKLNFIEDDYHNLEIHDTHAKSTSRFIFFPEDFNFEKKNTEKIISQIELVLSKVAEIVKLHLKCYPESNNCFEVFGIDFMIKKDFTVMLIEVNEGYGFHNENKNEYDTEESRKTWHRYIKEFVNWIYDNGIGPVYD